MSLTISRRPVYSPSGRFDAAALAIHAVTFVGISLVLAAALAYANGQEFYAVGWIWIIPAVILCTFARKAVAASKCRNPLVGFAIGLFGGLLTIAGYYHIDQCSRWGVDWYRLDRLPGYIAFRMETDGWWWLRGTSFPVVSPVQARPRMLPRIDDPIRWNWHWAALLGELVILSFIPACAGFLRALWPFSEKRNIWYTEDRVLLTKQSAAGLRQSLADGTVAIWAAAGVEKSLLTLAHTEARIWYCPRTGDSCEPEVYLALGADPPVLLSPEEAAGLTGLVPSLIDLVAPTTAKFETDSAPAAPTDPTAARLIQLTGPFSGRAQDPLVVLKGMALVWGLYLSPILVMGAFIGSGFLFQNYCDARGLSDRVDRVYVLVVGLPLVFAIAWWYRVGGGTPAAGLVQYYRRVIARQAGERLDPLFPPDDPGAVYVEVVPRRAWTDRSARRKLSDGGLLLIDGDSPALLYEGDRQRYVIPAAAVLRCEIEELIIGGVTEGLYAVVLMIRLDQVRTSYRSCRSMEDSEGRIAGSEPSHFVHES
jgi:hypothetical protein